MGFFVRAHRFKIMMIILVVASLLSLGHELRFFSTTETAITRPPAINNNDVRPAPIQHVHQVHKNSTKSRSSNNNGDGDGHYDDALRYVRSFRNNFVVVSSHDYSYYTAATAGRTGRGRLAFLHLPKTGGTSVEEVSARQNVSWGMCAFPRKSPIFEKHCPQYPPPPRGGASPSQPQQSSYGMWGIGDFWHISRAYFPMSQFDPYHNSELFMVVRNVYERMISEFYHRCQHAKGFLNKNRCDKKRLRYDTTNYVNEVIRQRLQEHQTPIIQQNPKLDKHMRRQYNDFAVGGPNNVRMVDYVLHLENIDDEFSKLMHAHSLDKIKLNIVSHIAGTTHREYKRKATTSSPMFGPEHLDMHSLHMINDYYDDDFQAFNYSKIIHAV